MDTLQYFPPSTKDDVFSYNFPNSLPSIMSTRDRITDQIDYCDDNKYKKSGQQKRSWNTDNFQWMNIKRTRKQSSPDGKRVLERPFPLVVVQKIFFLRGQLLGIAY